MLRVANRPVKYGIVPYLAIKCCVPYWTNTGRNLFRISINVQYTCLSHTQILNLTIMIKTKHREYYGQQNCRGGIYARPAPVICVSAHAFGGHGCLATDTTHRRCSQNPRLLKMSTTPDTPPRPQKRKRLQKYGRESFGRRTSLTGQRQWRCLQGKLSNMSASVFSGARWAVWHQTACNRRATLQTRKITEDPSVSVTVLHTPIISWGWYGMGHYVVIDFLSGCAFARTSQCMGRAYFSKLLWFDWLFRMLSFKSRMNDHLFNIQKYINIIYGHLKNKSY